MTRISDVLNNHFFARLGFRVIRTKWLQKEQDAATLARGASFGEEAVVLDRFIHELGIVEDSYVDIGASDGINWSNTVNLARGGWRGVCFECDAVKVAEMARLYRAFPRVSTCQARIAPANVCGFLQAYGIPLHFGVLSLDIDSYDYFVLDSLLGTYRPAIVIAEINEKIPPPLEFTVLYDEAYSWDESHFFGMSISQVEKLCVAHEYRIVQLEYNNVFLIDGNLYPHPGMSAREAYERGYRQKADRKAKFPWNRDVEALLTMDTSEAVLFLAKLFAAHEGKYSLTCSAVGERIQAEDSRKSPEELNSGDGR